MLKEIKEALSDVKALGAELRESVGKPGCPLKFLTTDNRRVQESKRVINPR